MTDHNTLLEHPPRTPRCRLTVPARLTWKDASGAVRFTSVRTREVTETGVVVECDASVSLPLYRLVHLQVEKTRARIQRDCRSSCETAACCRRSGRWRRAVPRPAPRRATRCAS